MPTIAPADPATAFEETDWVVTGGDLAPDHRTFVLAAFYGDLRVDPDAERLERASDYLVREWDPDTRTGVVNLLYDLPGVGGASTDTLPICVHFRRFRGVEELAIPLYHPDSSTVSERSLRFVYGAVDGRRGWMTHEMLTAAPDLSRLDPSHPCHPAAPLSPAGAGRATE